MARDYLIGDFLKRIKRPVELVADKDYKLVTIKMNHNGIVLRGTKKGSDIKSKMYEVKEGDFILSGIDARNGAFGIIPKDLDGAIVTNDFWYFEIDEKVISKRLFLELTATTWFDDICKKGSDGTTQRIRLQKNKFFNQQILLPEGDEQEKLLSTILEFKKGQNGLMKEVEIQNQLLTQLKQSILQEAIQGKLTADWRKQNPNTEPASEILNRIKSVKAQLIKDKKIKKEKALPSITEEEIPFELPAGWLWCRMQNYLDVRDGTHNTPKYVKSGIPLVTSKNLYTGELDLSNIKYISEQDHKKISKRSNVERDDILLAMIGSIGNPVIVDIEPNFSIKNVALIKYYLRDLSHPNYIKYFLETATQKFIKEARGGVQPFISLTKLRHTLFPIPPLKEQKVIVEKVETLMKQCQILEQEIKTSETNAKMLMQAVLKEAFEGKKEEVVI
jgi:type I restriction enzyme S subunit